MVIGQERCEPGQERNIKNPDHNEIITNKLTMIHGLSDISVGFFFPT